MIRQIQLTVNKFESDLECFDPPCGQGVLGFARCQLQQGFFAFVSVESMERRASVNSSVV